MNKVDSTSRPEHAVEATTTQLPRVPWNGWLGVLYVVVVFYAAQILAGLVVGIYAGLHHWSGTYAQYWLTNSVGAQFVYVTLAEGLTLGALYLFMRRYKFSFRQLGLGRVRGKDIGYAAAAIPIYYGLAVVALAIAQAFISGINTHETQQVGFSSAHGIAQLVMTFISLAILPPLTEEIMVRGFLYSSLKKVVSLASSVIFTSAIFAAAHLGEGSAGLLWTAAIQFFVLSLVLIYLREKTQSLWAPVFVHMANNTVAFVTLFLVH
ncbi:MAG TPA: CPBP family intramembrane glutamic endopeptidase [Candidatus Saccharimonadales bacterium]|nr:CPBP family intramembrane glutamic endopeptidase [Candidatus Saccharimonadales bacterium]